MNSSPSTTPRIARIRRRDLRPPQGRAARCAGAGPRRGPHDRPGADDGLPPRRAPLAAARRPRAVRRRRHEPLRQPDPVRPRRGPRALPARRGARRAARLRGRRRPRLRAARSRRSTPRASATAVEVEGLTEVLDGDPARRGPEHFRGVTTVVAKLFNTRRPRRRLLRPEGRPAAGRDPAHGPRPRHPGADRGAADRARGRRPGDELAQRLSGRRGAGARRGALAGAARRRARAPARSRLPAGIAAARAELAAARDRARVPGGARPRRPHPGRASSTAGPSCSRSPPGSAARA